MRSIYLIGAKRHICRSNNPNRSLASFLMPLSQTMSANSFVPLFSLQAVAAELSTGEFGDGLGTNSQLLCIAG